MHCGRDQWVKLLGLTDTPRQRQRSRALWTCRRCGAVAHHLILLRSRHVCKIESGRGHGSSPTGNDVVETKGSDVYRRTSTIYQCVGLPYGASRAGEHWTTLVEIVLMGFQVFETQSHAAMTTLITEPVSGNILLGGFADGIVKLFDLRQTKKTALLAWQADTSTNPSIKPGESLATVGVVLGESKHITSAW